MKLAENRSYFRLFLDDVGLLSCMCGMDVAKGILSDRLGVNYGSIYENDVAQELRALGGHPCIRQLPGIASGGCLSVPKTPRKIDRRFRILPLSAICERF